jgi:hypothetical protein
VDGVSHHIHHLLPLLVDQMILVQLEGGCLILISAWDTIFQVRVTLVTDLYRLVYESWVTHFQVELGHGGEARVETLDGVWYSLG